MYNIGDIVQKRYQLMGRRMRRFYLILDKTKMDDVYTVMCLSDEGEVLSVALEKKTDIYSTKLVA